MRPVRRVGAYAIWLLSLLLVIGSGTQSRAQFGSFASDANTIQVGRVAPALKISTWINSPPLDLVQLFGKVVLIRFFSDNPTSAVALNEFYRTYKDQGFVIVGIYTPQPMPGTPDLDYVKRLALSVGFEFPIGIDGSWEVVNRYWLTDADADMASAGFLIDRKGVVRLVQGYGLYEKDSRNRTARREYEALKQGIEALLQEEAPGGAAASTPPEPAQ